ncbi:MAG: hypothetical protein AB7O91_10400 [Sphingomonas sp.]
MLSSLLALAMMMQSDTTRASREAFTRCLSQFVDASMRARKTAEQFQAEFAQACTAEQTAFRDAIISRDTAMRATRASAEESARLEIDDARANFADRFEAPRAQP